MESGTKNKAYGKDGGNTSLKLTVRHLVIFFFEKKVKEKAVKAQSGMEIVEVCISFKAQL